MRSFGFLYVNNIKMVNFEVLYICLTVVLIHLTSAKSYVIETVFVNVGESAEFVCNHNHQSLEYLRWSYRPHDERGREIDLYDLTNDEVIDNYEASCLADEPVCRLKLLKANSKSAGTYFCNTVNGKFKVIDPVINLVVGSLICMSNVSSNHWMVGENDCNNLHPEFLKRTCMFEYHGNLTQSPEIKWIRKYKNGKEFYESFQSRNHNKFNFSLHDIIKINSDMNDVIFKCHAKKLSKIKPCSIPAFRVFSIKQSSPKIRIADNAKNITCFFQSSANVKCSCLWTQNVGKVELKIRKCLLPEIYRKQPGTYVCNVRCQLSAHKYCNVESVDTVVVEAKKKPVSSNFSGNPLIILSVCLLVVVLLVLGIILVLIYVYILKSPHTSTSTPNETTNLNQYQVSEATGTLPENESYIEATALETISFRIGSSVEN